MSGFADARREDAAAHCPGSARKLDQVVIASGRPYNLRPLLATAVPCAVLIWPVDGAAP